MEVDKIWRLERGDGPLVAVALHDGHHMREEVAAKSALSEAERLREEDPFTSQWTAMAPTRLVVLRSRFEVDLNRPRERAVYRVPDDAWGLELWREALPEPVAERSLAEYDAFYAMVRDLFEDLQRQYGRFVVYDIHSYNHRRDGPDAAPADAAANPAVNLGTGTMNRARWANVVERFLVDLRDHPFPGGPLDVRENVRFRGANLARWSHDNFPDSACVLALEFKKFFMDEWTGVPDLPVIDAIGRALGDTVPGVLAELERT